MASEKLRFVVEAELPAPIARDFARVAGAHGVAAGPIAANLLGGLLRHAAFVLVADRLARGATPELRKRITADLRAAPSHGQLWGLARELADALTGEVDGPAPRLAARLSDRVMRAHLDAAIALRNEVIKKGGVDDGDALKRAAIDAVRQLVFLRELPLIAITTMSSRDQLHIYEASLLVGTGDARARLETDLELIVGHVYLIDPIARVALDLHPLYIATPQLAWLARASGSPQFEAGDGQAMTRKELAGDVVELVEGRVAKLPVARLLALRGTGHESERRRLAAGDVVANRYRVVQLVGAGGMANVYEVIDTGDGDATRALKVLPYDYIRDRAMLARFRREAEDTKLLDHPNVMPTLASGEDVGDNFLVMPLATGWPRLDGTRALDASQLAHPVPLADVFAIGKQVAEALHYVHDKGIIHRDLKPRNLLLDEDRRVRLSDFGVARTADAMTLTMTGLGIGTPEYMAPEQLDGADPEPAADLYGLGAVLYELLAGAPPFTGKSPLAVMHAVASKPVPDPRTARPETPAPLAQLVKRLLAKDPTKRPRTAWQVYRVLAGEETLAPDEAADAIASSARSDAQPRAIASGSASGASSGTASDAQRLIDGRYRLGRKVADSGLSETFEADDIRTNTHVILKLFRSGFGAPTAEAFARFASVAAAASRLAHPTIARLLDAHLDGEGEVYTVAELVAGENLHDLVTRDGPLAAALVRTLGAQLADGLASAHAAGLVHRDIKPANILVSGDRPVLLDFGVDQIVYAPRSMANTATGGMLMCSPTYMAPELISDSATRAAPGDVYSLGAALYFLLTGKPPIDGTSQLELLRKLDGDVVKPSKVRAGIPPALDRLVLAMLAKDARARPSMTEVAERLRAADTARRLPVVPIAIALALVIAILIAVLK